MPRVVPSQAVNVIDKLFPKFREQKSGERRYLSASNDSQLVALLEVVQLIPSELINLSDDDYVEFISSIAAVRNMIETWKTNHSAQFESIPGLRPLSPVSLIRQALAKCPDEFPSTTTAELIFITNPDFRNRLRLDIGAIEGALSNSEWKAATVLAGSVVEALLLWALQQENSTNVSVAVASQGLKASSNLEEWNLFQYIEVAAELKIITADTATQCRLGKDFRNLIHPGRAQRLGQACNRGTALSAVAAVEHVVNDLNLLGKR